MAARNVIVTINLSKPGIQPPLYIAGSFTHPAWQPRPMQFTISEDNECQFHAGFEIEEGHDYQYKFRVGEGDWWILDEDAPTAIDDQGNRNNLLAVPSSQKPSTKDTHPLSGVSTHDFSSRSSVAGEMSSQHKSEVGGAGQSRPALVVEKTGAEPRHGDNFGDGATPSQKEAHRLRSLDAKPDQVIVADKTTDDSASTAAEVADVAVGLDIPKPTPPISDAEAGRIGLRRLSQTPVADVAAVASEVSDSAALLDTDESALRIEMPRPFTIDGANTDVETPGSGEVTPWEDRAPRFDYENIQPPQPGEQTAQPPRQYEQSFSSEEEKEDNIDLNDPTIEEFPNERRLILQRVRSSATRLSQDETVFGGVSAGPVGTTTDQPERSDSSSLLGRVAGEARTPSLDSIPEEEHAHKSRTFSTLPSSMYEAHDQPQLEGVEGSQAEILAKHKEEPESSVEAYDPSLAAPLPGAELTQKAVPTRTLTDVGIQNITCDAHTSRQILPDSRTMGVGQTMDGARTEIERFQSSPSVDGSSQPTRDAEEYGEPGVPGKWPTTATASHSSNSNAQAGHLPSSPVTDSTTSSAIEGSSSTPQLRNRKATVSPAPERPLTPSSMRSANMVGKSRNLLKNFLRMIFVDWIGGIIKRLCRRRRRV